MTAFRPWLLTAFTSASAFVAVAANEAAEEASRRATSDGLSTAKMLTDYYHQMSVPKPFVVRRGDVFLTHRAALRNNVLQNVGLRPMPERVPLDVHQSPALDHPWCTVRRVHYQLWPGVYSSGLLFVPKEFGESPSPAMLCPHGHWSNGNAHPEVQRRCLNFARLGYVTFSSTQNHYEDLYIGVSHQTLMIWNNMRALDYLQSLPQVDESRIGVAGASGGGLQTQMLVALDDRVKAATVVGLTCDFREIMFPNRHHCTCNHFPQVMRLTDHPEISALGLPTPLQFLTMNDWTKNFERDNFPTIQELYAVNGAADRVECKYYDTPHSYDKPKRERTYWWMERWVRGRDPGGPVAEPDDMQTFPAQTLTDLSARVPENKGFAELSRIFTQDRGYQPPALADTAQWDAYCRRMQAALIDLLGLNVVLDRVHKKSRSLSDHTEGEFVVQRIAFPSEGGILVPTTVVRRHRTEGRIPVVILLGEDRDEASRRHARNGSLVVLPDVRCYGDMLSTGGGDEKLQRRAWERNGIVWGRPVPGMACTDILGVLDGLSARPDAEMSQVSVISRNSAGQAIAALFAAATDRRIKSLDADICGCCFEARNLPLVSCVLQNGDVLQWAALMADRKLTLRNVPSEAGDLQWLRDVFALAGNGNGISFE